MIKEPKNILIVRTDRIGDLVLTLPLAGLIKKHYPNSKVSFLVRNYTKSIVNNHPFIDEVIILKEVDGKTDLFSLSQRIFLGSRDLEMPMRRIAGYHVRALFPDFQD